MFEHLAERCSAMTDSRQCDVLVEQGKRHILEENWEALGQLNSRLWDFLPQEERSSDNFRHVTGIV
jgi:hypothetical protein